MQLLCFSNKKKNEKIVDAVYVATAASSFLEIAVDTIK